jgi:tetratricopeptide (TPR) repeat protein
MELSPSEEDLVLNRDNVLAAKRIFPEHDSIVISEADQLSNEGRIDEALALLGRPDKKDDVTFLMIRASVLTSRAFADLGNPAAHVYVQAQLGEVAALYQRALEIEPQAIEVMAQFAQLKSMVLGDLDGALSLLQQALPLARSRDEVLEICQVSACLMSKRVVVRC